MINAEEFALYKEALLAGREWSWSVVVIGYLIAGVLLRGLFLSGLIQQIKSLPSRYSKDIKNAYLRKAFTGWLLFYVAAAVIAYVWISFEAVSLHDWHSLIFAALLLFFVSLLLHAKALGAASIYVLRDFIIEREAHQVLRTKS